MDRADLSALIARLEAAEVGSRELDAEIWAAMQSVRVKVADVWPVYGDEERTGIRFTLPPKRTETTTNSVGPYRHAEPVTTSLDAALALAERVCPDHHSSVGNLPVSDEADYEEHHHFGALLYSRYTKPYDALGHGATRPLALCIAILRAKQGEGE